MLVIGSWALQRFVPPAPRGAHKALREPRDIDLIGTLFELEVLLKRLGVGACPIDKGTKFIFQKGGMIHEFEVAWPESSAEAAIKIVERLGLWGWVNVESLGKVRAMLPTLDVLYALKMTHRFKKNSRHFLKTMRDIKLMRALGAKLRPELAEFMEHRERETYAYQHPKLNVKADEFFVPIGDVKYIYNHDDIHEAIKSAERPAYTYFKRDGQEVQTSRALFDALPEAMKLFSVLEEAYVLALERSQIPHLGALTARQSFEIALEKVCTNISSGWWREYAWEHYDEVMGLYNDYYVAKFQEALNAGRIRKHEEIDYAN